MTKLAQLESLISEVSMTTPKRAALLGKTLRANGLITSHGNGKIAHMRSYDATNMTLAAMTSEAATNSHVIVAKLRDLPFELVRFEPSEDGRERSSLPSDFFTLSPMKELLPKWCKKLPLNLGEFLDLKFSNPDYFQDQGDDVELIETPFMLEVKVTTIVGDYGTGLDGWPLGGTKFEFVFSIDFEGQGGGKRSATIYGDDLKKIARLIAGLKPHE